MVKNTYIIIISSFTRYSYISLIYILIRKKNTTYETYLFVIIRVQKIK